MKSSEIPLGEKVLITDIGALMVFLRRCDDGTFKVIINNQRTDSISNHLWNPENNTFTKVDTGGKGVYLWGEVGKEQYASLDIKHNRFEWLDQNGKVEVLELDNY